MQVRLNGSTEFDSRTGTMGYKTKEKENHQMEMRIYVSESDLWDGMTVDEITDLMEQLNLQSFPSELWDGMTTDEVIDAIACAEVKVSQ